MTTEELAEIARRTRKMREAGVALLIATGALATLFVIPFGPTRGEDGARMAATSTPRAPFPAPATDAHAAIVYDLSTGTVLFEKNADAQLPLASLTKLLTVYAALATFSPATPVTISETAAAAEAPHAFDAGETLALADLARLTLTASLNDGAAAIAEAAAAGRDRSTPATLAGAAAALALSQTYAHNGSGLDVNAAVSGGYGSARDMARLAGALIDKAPGIALATTEPTAYAQAADGTGYRVRNTDPIAGTIPGLLLSKTGFTDLAGGNLALVFDAGMGHPIAVVVLGAGKDTRFSDGMALVEATFAYFADTPAP
jgi:D-alanyl-D-alanine carboxypeptidase (penicillin-binding protein 5/6)